MLDVDNLGQVFTPEKTVETMIQLIKNKGSILEPSCGNGAFFKRIKNCIGIEFDSSVCPTNALNIDFFDYSINNKYDTIIGNPPYVKYKKINNKTKEKLNMELFNERSNLYLFFIQKSIEHLNKNGELIFIVPRDFIKSSSAIKLNNFIYENGTITDWFDLGDEIIFPGFSPNCVIFRFEKNNYTRKTNINNKQYDFINMNGQLIFSNKKYSVKMSDIFTIKVGGASGADSLFESENGNCDFVYSKTHETGKTKKMFYNIEHKELLKNKDLLLNRKIKKFDEKNWFKWGRSYFKSEELRIYVNVKTRKNNPFFIHEAKAYDGSILALIIKNKNIDIHKLCKSLNELDWSDLGFICEGRYLFSQKSLEQVMLPDNFNVYI